ncbi:MAG: hypothetical protein LBR23_03925 [Spirochaetaceae bacterium]|jgi:hypothetical protein|nr:hypothetical protein [Spirochaetaceae bacterium]
MKNFVFAGVILLCAAAFAGAQDSSSKEGLTYVTVRVYRVFESPEAYIVMYPTHSNKAASVAIPKTWQIQQPGKSARKLIFQKLRLPLEPFMTLFYRDGVFERVYLTMPLDKTDSRWGLSKKAGAQGDLDKESISIEF